MIFYSEESKVKYIILDDDGNLISKETFNRMLPVITQSAFRTSDEQVNEATMEKSTVLEFKERKQQYSWNYRVFEFYEGKLNKMTILAKFE